MPSAARTIAPGRRTCFFLAALALPALMGAGCNKAEKAASTEEAKKDEDKYKPPPPPEEAKDGIESKLLVSASNAESVRRETYIPEPSMGVSNLHGTCFVEHSTAVPVDPQQPLELAGPTAIKDPEKGEEDYYRAHRPTEPPSLGRCMDVSGKNWKKFRYGVAGALLIVKDLETGRRDKPPRPRFEFDLAHRQYSGKNHYWTRYSPPNIEYAMAPQILEIANTDCYGCRLVMTHVPSGKKVWEADLPKYEDSNFPGERFGSNANMKAPQTTASPILNETGHYCVQCTRHPWHQMHLMLNDNPYVTMSLLHNWDAKEHGRFRLEEIPPGTHTVEVWHPYLKPKQSSYELEFKPNKTTELMVEFEVPGFLKEAREPLPTDPIVEWAWVGPFDMLAGKDAKTPEKTADWNAKYENAFGDPIAWKPIDATKEGILDLSQIYKEERAPTVTYFAAILDSPKAQRIVFGEDSDDSIKMWLNGTLIYAGNRHVDVRGIEALALGELKQGKNTLLVRLLNADAHRERRDGILITYRAEGVKASRPPVK